MTLFARAVLAGMSVLGATLAQAQSVAPSVSLVDPAVSSQGFSWFLGLGRQDIAYRESGSLLPFESRARTSSPLLMTGALYAVNRDVLFALHSESTYFAGSARETWSATSAAFNGVTLTNPVLQTNQFSLTHTDTQLLGHYRLREDWFVVGGPSVRTLSFKRHSFVVGPDAAVNTPASTTVEESSGELLLNLGIALESAKVKGAPRHYGLRAVMGLPIVRRVENTGSPAVKFKGTQGHDLSMEGRYSWALLEDMHLGVWSRWTRSSRAAQSQTLNGVSYELPRSRLDALGYGVELLWKL